MINIYSIVNLLKIYIIKKIIHLSNKKMKALSNINKILIFLSIILSINSIKVHVTGRRSDYCFTKTIFADEDSLKISFIVSSSRKENLDIILKTANGTILYKQKNLQNGEYQSDVLQSGDYTLCFIPRMQSEYYITFEIVNSYELGSSKDLTKDQEIKGMRSGVTELEKLFFEFENNLKFIVDRRNHHHFILKDIVKSIKVISTVKIIIIITLSLFQVFIIKKFFGEDKRQVTIKANSKEFL